MFTYGRPREQKQSCGSCKLLEFVVGKESGTYLSDKIFKKKIDTVKS